MPPPATEKHKTLSTCLQSVQGARHADGTVTQLQIGTYSDVAAGCTREASRNRAVTQQRQKEARPYRRQLEHMRSFELSGKPAGTAGLADGAMLQVTWSWGRKTQSPVLTLGYYVEAA